MTQIDETLWAGEVPMGATTFYMYAPDTVIYRHGECSPLINLPKGEWKIVGEVTKDYIDFDTEPHQKLMFDDDLDHEAGFRNLLAFKGFYFENPLGEKVRRIAMGAESDF